MMGDDESGLLYDRAAAGPREARAASGQSTINPITHLD